MTIDEAIEEYLIYLSAEKGDSNSTFQSYKIDLKQFSSFVDNKDISKLGTEDVSDFALYLNDEEYSSNSCIRKVTCIKGLYKFLKNEKHINIHLSDIKIPKKEKRLPEVLSEEEINKLFSVLDKSNDEQLLDLTMMEITYSSGLRVSEVINLRIDNISFDGKYIKVFGKGSKQRIIPFGIEALDTIELYMDSYRNNIKTSNRALFINKEGKKLSRQYFYYKIKKYAHLANINKDISPHTLRHSFATRLIENGAQISQVQALLGHSKVETTKIYTHISKSKELEEYDKGMKR